MAFREKSAWIMAFALMAGGALYFAAVFAGWAESGQPLPPLIPLVLIYTAFLVVVAIIGHVVIAVMAPTDANAPTDERERQIFDRAGHYSSYVFAIGVLLSLGTYLVTYSGNLLFYTVFASLMLAQIAEYLLQIVFYRTAI